MVQAAAGEHDVSGAGSSMWPALVLGLLTAIFAWIWYRGGGEGKESPGHRDPGDTEHTAAGPDSHELNYGQQGIQEKKLVSQEKSQIRTDESKERGLCASELDGQSITASNANIPLNVREEAIVVHQPSEVPKRENLQEPLIDVLRREELQANVQEPLLDVSRREELQADLHELLDVSRREELQADLHEPLIDVSRREELQADLQEPLLDVLRREELQADLQELLIDVSRREELQADLQANLADVPEKEIQQANVPRLQTESPLKNNSEEHLRDLVQSEDESYKQVSSNKGVHNGEVDMELSGSSEASEMLNEDEVYPMLKKEVQLGLEEGCPQVNLGKAVGQVTGEVVCLTLTAKEHGAPTIVDDSCHGSLLTLENGNVKEFVHFGNENATGCQFADSFIVREKTKDLLKTKESLNQDPYLEMVNTLNGNATAAHPFMKRESVERCDGKNRSVCPDSVKPPTDLQDVDGFATDERMSDVRKLGTGPESSPVDVCNLMSSQGKEMAGLSSSSTDEKTSFESSSKANIHDVDHQKTRKIATIQPTPHNVNFAFKVHYITHSDSQIIAVTGDHEKLGKWEAYVPLTSGNGGFWSHLITLPADTNFSWKFVMVENGKIKRWEECNNRFLNIAHEDIEVHLWWGYP